MTRGQKYSDGFASYVRSSNEKSVFYHEIKKLIHGRGVVSLLDIGAGGGELAAQIAKEVIHYVAVESNPEHVARLRSLGLWVLDSIFPVAVKRQFDLVLLSHVIPWRAEKLNPFLNAAFDLVAGVGMLLAITYNDQADSHWVRLLNGAGLGWYRRDEGRLDRFMQAANVLARDVRSREVVTHVTSRSRDDVMAALAFVYSNGEEERLNDFLAHASSIGSYLEQYRALNGNYTFPLTHIFLEMYR